MIVLPTFLYRVNKEYYINYIYYITIISYNLIHGLHLSTWIAKWIFKYELTIFLSIVLPQDTISNNSRIDHYTKHHAVILINDVWRRGENIEHWRLKRCNIFRKNEQELVQYFADNSLTVD